jgi:hypothetical protein
MTVADKGLRGIVQRNLPKASGWLWTPIETMTHAGVPDSFWAHQPTGLSGWVEHKATGGWAVSVRPHQIAWMERHAHAGVRCCFLIRASGAGSASGKGDALWAVAGAYARVLNEQGLGELPPEALLGVWTGQPTRWNWPEIQSLLLT